jgi:hypothetical protein
MLRGTSSKLPYRRLGDDIPTVILTPENISEAGRLQGLHSVNNTIQAVVLILSAAFAWSDSGHTPEAAALQKRVLSSGLGSGSSRTHPLPTHKTWRRTRPSAGQTPMGRRRLRVKKVRG